MAGMPFATLPWIKVATERPKKKLAPRSRLWGSAEKTGEARPAIAWAPGNAAKAASALAIKTSTIEEVEAAPVLDEPGDLVAGPTTRGSAKSGYSLWAFDGSDWTFTKDRSAPGYIASAAPTVPGRFKGQVRAILSIPSA